MKQGFGHTGPRNLAPGELKWQVRINLSAEFAAAARDNQSSPALQPLEEILREHDAHLSYQKLAFAKFIPYFRDEEQALHLDNIDKALQAMGQTGDTSAIDDAWEAAKAADDSDDVDATLEAMGRYRQATDEFISRHAGNANVEGYKQAVDEFMERYCRLYLWTKAAVQREIGRDAARAVTQGENSKNFYSTRFSIYAEGGQEVYSKETADALVRKLAPLKEAGMISKIDTFNSDPASNPQAPAKFQI